ncbi:MAG TPA: choice-of-anchor Q domain-containing protein [Thermoleophilaceae bacterium]|nr:choice-of-anchor Q domain-containing protein [Thermoleophilaceae bacterium]
MTRRWALLGALLLAFSLPSAAHAETFNVNSTTEGSDANPGNGACAGFGGACTVRAAIQEANALPGADKVVIPAGTYLLSSGLAVNSTVDIEGPAGARATILDGVPSARVITVNGGGSMRYSGITLTGGGGGLVVQNADITLDRVAIRDNHITSAGTLEGGAVWVFSGALTITRSTLSGNTLTSTGSQSLGGGVAVYPNTTLNITNSTIAGNKADGSSGGRGGGISVRSDVTAVLRHVTLSGNTATGASGGIGGNVWRQDASAAVSIGDSIVAGGVASSSPDCGGVAPTATGRNIDSGTTCGFPASHLNNTSPQLSALGNRGGPTDTAVPSGSSPARDAALACAPGGTDQRGATAPSGTACDIGATEVSADLATTLTASRSSVPSGDDITFVAKVVNGGLDAAPGTELDATVPAGATLVLAEPSSGTCTGAHCELGTLPVGGSVSVTLVVRAPATGPFSTSVAASSANPDPNSGNNGASRATAVVPTPVTGPCAIRTAGTPSADVLRGGAAGDRLLGRGGNDKLFGRGGDDCLSGAGGKDRLNGGAGDDDLVGGKKKDRFVAGGGDDSVNSADGRRETVKCGKGVDDIRADADDTLRGCERVQRV